jgi:hypothetical protein
MQARIPVDIIETFLRSERRYAETSPCQCRDRARCYRRIVDDLAWLRADGATMRVQGMLYRLRLAHRLLLIYLLSFV